MDFPVILLILPDPWRFSYGASIWSRPVCSGLSEQNFEALGSALRNRFKAFFAGIGVTACCRVTQRRALWLPALRPSGLVDLVPALAVMLGANVGTTRSSCRYCRSTSPRSPALILIGVLMFPAPRLGWPRDFGRVLIGLGLVLMALHQFVDLSSLPASGHFSARCPPSPRCCC